MGSAIVRKLTLYGFDESNIIARTHSQLDLINQKIDVKIY
jgi:hypothetical protein